MSVRLFFLSADTRSERRYDLHTPTGTLKQKSELVTGIPAASQRLELRDAGKEDGPAIAVMEEDDRVLGYYGVRELQTLTVVDTNLSASLTGQLQDVTDVDKFELTDAEYAQRRDSMLAYKQRNKLGGFADELHDSPVPAKGAIPNITLGYRSRCEVESTEPGLHKRGTVRFIGIAVFAKGTWVGVDYDGPMGKNDGSVQGQRYFTCKTNHGAFARPEKVKVGDYLQSMNSSSKTRKCNLSHTHVPKLLGHHGPDLLPNHSC